MKTTLITTVFNEAQGILDFLDSISKQSVLPDEVIIVDGGSTDQTVERLKEFEKLNKEKKNSFVYRYFIKKGNRSVGRNYAINKSRTDIILITDAGCLLDKNWVLEITKPFKKNNVDVVAGYYKAEATTPFQKCITPYVLVMPDRVDPTTFLPATRSMALLKSAWKDVGGFDDEYSHNEDYVFARKLSKMKKKIVFANEAVVRWIPRNNFSEAFIMFWRFAYGDAEAGILRLKVAALFLRYVAVILLLVSSVVLKSTILLFGLVLLFFLYMIWAVAKNYRYCRVRQAYVLLPLLQLTADLAVMKGTIQGGLKRYGI